MKNSTAIIKTLASWGLLILAIFNLAQYAQSQQSELVWFFSNNKGVDDVTRWENRLEQLKESIPAGVKIVGYISDDPQDIEYVLTQYAIIPKVLRRGAGPNWIIANYPGKAIDPVLKNLGLKNYTIKNFGFGLYLLRKK